MILVSATTPGRKLGWAICIGLLLALPLFSVWLLVYDRESQARTASEAIIAGWGGAQVIGAPIIAAPYRLPALSSQLTGVTAQGRQPLPPLRQELDLAPERMMLMTRVATEVRRKSIYEAVVYVTRVTGSATFVIPEDVSRGGMDLGRTDFGRAELRFAVSDPRGIGANPEVTVNGQNVRLQPGGGSAPGNGFFAWVDASAVTAGPLKVDFSYDLRGSDSLSLVPRAGTTRWTVDSSWPSPSFEGGFLPLRRSVSESGFNATYDIGNLATGHALAELRDSALPDRMAPDSPDRVTSSASISLIQPVDFYSRVDRSAKYGFLFIGFTFLALLMFDIIGGARVSPVEYLLTGAALVLFFVLLLAFAEIIGFLPAYLLAAGSITGLITSYSAAVLKSWRRAYFIGALLAALYAVLYVLLSLEAFSLLIGSLLLFAALAGVMYATRNVDWSATKATSA